LFLAAVVFGAAYTLGVETEGWTRWGKALYGDDPEDAHHSSRTGGKRKR